VQSNLEEFGKTLSRAFVSPPSSSLPKVIKGLYINIYTSFNMWEKCVVCAIIIIPVKEDWTYKNGMVTWWFLYHFFVLINKIGYKHWPEVESSVEAYYTIYIIA
jgi:hypothetical protein